MRRIFTFFRKRGPTQVEAWSLTHEQHAQIVNLLAEIGLAIVRETRGPVPLLKFARRMLGRLDDGGRPLRASPVEFCDALKKVIRDMDHPRLRVLSPSKMTGVGYVYDMQDQETWPVRSSR